ncbi:DUF397 domain-containing protein [Streptomyces sp. H10-C2]|uniref:DUF397 domain-containing protein n=1 Tax=unclassified Streptomyces TaxID=2593676 RepID=UPI0024BBE01A|nr:MULTISPECIES: DUF397 domain-containing protein [unclassified Streptomyces]MDJ0341191.1 DUF397 domain-containing protein [Streptomyces sp. PH10-H1]MDJ0369456.1 DUF397 domain-containing protein [Streptomyces sp. H10-C2]
MTVWKKSSFSGEGGNNCIQLATTPAGVAIRESTDPGAIVTTTPVRLRAFLDAVKTGALDAPRQA